jgi:predicted GNAT family N-acyltransferase
MVDIVICTTKDQVIDHFLIRKEVFVIEQNVTMDDEFDLVEKERILFLVYFDGKPVGAARLYLNKEKSKIERVCILKEYRKLGIGKQLIDTMVNHCHENNCFNIHLGAQTHAIKFYEKCGFTQYGELFYDANIPHYHMKKESKL